MGKSSFGASAKGGKNGKSTSGGGGTTAWGASRGSWTLGTGKYSNEMSGRVNDGKHRGKPKDKGGTGSRGKAAPARESLGRSLFGPLW